MRRTRSLVLLVLLPVCALTLSACQREKRDFRPSPPFAVTVRYTEDYEKNAYALSEGKRLYAAFNCQGCHADGGGGMGPPLMDDKWIYGYEPKDIYTTITEGRPNGMPAFGKKVPPARVWQLVAYVRSLSGLGSKDAAPGRNDHMQTKPPENSKDPEVPVLAPPPDAGEVPK